MTPSEQVQFLVDRLWGGKWPSVKRFLEDDPCGTVKRGWTFDGTFDPLTRIEDAFLVVDRLIERGAWNFNLFQDLLWGCSFTASIGGGISACFESRHKNTIQQAIVSAAVAALEGGK